MHTPLYHEQNYVRMSAEWWQVCRNHRDEEGSCKLPNANVRVRTEGRLRHSTFGLSCTEHHTHACSPLCTRGRYLGLVRQ